VSFLSITSPSRGHAAIRSTEVGFPPGCEVVRPLASSLGKSRPGLQGNGENAGIVDARRYFLRICLHTHDSVQPPGVLSMRSDASEQWSSYKMIFCSGHIVWWFTLTLSAVGDTANSYYGPNCLFTYRPVVEGS